MKPIIVQPPDFSGAARTELKQWLGISRAEEDELLDHLLEASTELCAAFIGRYPLEVHAKETLPASAGSYALQAEPVLEARELRAIHDDGPATELTASQARLEIGNEGRATVDLPDALSARAIEIEVAAGIAPDWETLPHTLRQGILRMAAFQYSERGAATTPPASVSALWQSWRKMKLG